MRPIFDGVSAYVDVTLTGNVDASAPFRASPRATAAKGGRGEACVCRHFNLQHQLTHQ